MNPCCENKKTVLITKADGNGRYYFETWSRCSNVNPGYYIDFGEGNHVLTSVKEFFVDLGEMCQFH